MFNRLWIFDMGFPERVVQLRKKRGWTQQGLAERVGVKVLQIRRYENASSQPTLEVIKKLAVALAVTADELIFDAEERGPSDDLKLQFDEEERKVARAVLESLILKHHAKRAFAE